MRFLERTKVYSFADFRIENNGDIMKLDKQLGIWSRTSKKLYKAIVVFVACMLFCKTLNVIPENIELFNNLCDFAKYGVFINVSISCISNIVIESKNFIKASYGDMFDGITLMCILATIAKYLCSNTILL